MAGIDPALQLSDRFTHIVQTDHEVVLVGDEDSLALEHPSVVDTVRLVDGRRTAVQIAEALAGATPPEVTHFSLLSLEKAGIIEAVEPVREDPERQPTWHSPRVGQIAARLMSAWDSRGASCLAIVRDEAVAGAPLLLAQDYLDRSLLDADGALGTSPRILVRLGRRRVWIGPRLISGTTACVACLQERLRLNMTGRALVHSSGGQSTLRVSNLRRDVPRQAFFWAAQGVLDLYTGGGDPVVPVIHVRDADGLSSRHHVQRLPHCARCGDPSLTVSGPDLELAPRPRLRRGLGGYRSVSPGETLRRYGSLVSPLTGVARHLRKVPVAGMDLVHVYTASHALEYQAASVRAVREDRQDTSGGKGRTDLDAKVSALCETIERFSSLHRGTEPVRCARLSELGHEAIHPNDLMLFSERQLRKRHAWNRLQAGDFQLVQEPYEDQVIEWSQLRSLATGARVLVPSSHVFFSFRGEGSAFCKGDSNGLAAGNCLEEAILQGFLELVERDAVAIWWYNRARRPGIELESFDDPYIAGVQVTYRSLGRSLWAVDLTTDLGIPCIAALSHAPGRACEDIVFGFGAHLDARIAVSRAITELNQMLPTMLRSREERRRQLLPEFRDAIDWWDTAQVDEEPYLLPDEAVPARARTSFPAPEAGDLRECVRCCVDRAVAVGLDVLAYDLTRPDVGLPVVRVVAPGLRHFWRRLGPGRLYDVPVRLAWLGEPTREEEMNPVSMFV